MPPRIPWEFGKKKTVPPTASDAGSVTRDGEVLNELLQKWARSEASGGDPHTANRIGDIYLAKGSRQDALEWFEKAMTAYLDKGMFAPAFSVGIKAESKHATVPATIHELLILAASRRGLLRDVEDRVRSYLTSVASSQDSRTMLRAVTAILKHVDGNTASTMGIDRTLVPYHAKTHGLEAAAERAYRRSFAHRRQGSDEYADELAHVARQLAPNAKPPADSEGSTPTTSDENDWLFDPTANAATVATQSMHEETFRFIDFASDAPVVSEPDAASIEKPAAGSNAQTPELTRSDNATLSPEMLPPSIDLSLTLTSVDSAPQAVPRPTEGQSNPDPHHALAALRGPHINAHLQDLLQQASLHFDDLISPTDYETWYDLGITYNEMGLHEQAAVELRKAAESPDPIRRLAVAEALGDCFIQMGQSALAADYLQRCLPPTEALTEEHFSYLGIAYLAAVALTDVGETARALALLVFVANYAPFFKDTAKRLHTLQRAAT